MPRGSRPPRVNARSSPGSKAPKDPSKGSRGPILVWSGLALVLGFMVGHRVARPAYQSGPIVEAVRKVAKLATVEMEVSDVLKFEEVRTILVIDIPKSAVVRLRGKVTGGFDLMNGFTVEADDDAKTIRVLLPRAQVLSVEDRVEWFNETAGWLNPVTIADRNRWTSWARGSLARTAKSRGLIEKAEQNARDLILGSVEALGWKGVVEVSPIPNTRPDLGLAPKK